MKTRRNKLNNCLSVYLSLFPVSTNLNKHNQLRLLRLAAMIRDTATIKRLAIFLVLFISPFVGFSQSANVSKTIVTFDSIATPHKYQMNYLSGDYLHPIYGIDTSLTGKIIGKNLKGKVFFELNVVKGIFNGEQKYFYEDGSIYDKASFNNGLWVGEYLSYYPNGKIAVKYNYKKGLQDGVQIGYWENGNKNVEEFFVDGVLKYSNAWYEDGKPQGDLDYSVSDLPTDNCLENMGKSLSIYNVKEFKESISLELKIDSVVYSNYTSTIPASFNLQVGNESDLIKIDDTLLIKIFITRNYKYGQKIYSFNWDYFRKTEKCVQFIANSGDINLYYNLDTPMYGQGMGIKGSSDYFLIYYRYTIY